MQEQIALQKLLLTKYEEYRARNPQFSRRSFSKRLGISPGAMSELLNGQRQVSRKLAERIAEKLQLDPEERAAILSLFPTKSKRHPPGVQRPDPLTPSYLRLSADQFRVIAEWYHTALFALIRTPDFRNDPDWIAERLQISVTQVQEAIDRLKRLHLLKAEGKTLVAAPERYRTTDDIANTSIRRAHTQYLEKAREALEALPVTDRDFTSMMVTCNYDQLPRAKELIRKFRDDFAQEIEARPGQEVFQLGIQLYPLTHKSKEGKK